MATIRLLLVEDDLADQLAFKRCVELKRLPYQYKTVGSLAEAKTALTDEIFDIILVDLALGDGMAFDLLPFIPKQTPVVFVTGSGDEESAVKALKAGVADYVCKDHDGEYLNLLPLIIDKVLQTQALAISLENYHQDLEIRVAARTAELHEEIAERHRIESRLAEEKEKALVTLRSIADAVMSTDNRGRIEFMNPAAEKLIGWRLEQLQGQPIDSAFQLIDEVSRQPLSNPVMTCLTEDRTIILTHTALLIDRHGQEHAVQDSAAPIHDDRNRIRGSVLVFSDVSHSRQLVGELAYHASHDALTGLVNRREFENRLHRLLLQQKQTRCESAFCYLDLDQFKIINDTCGHIAGDELLKQISVLMQSQVRISDTLARLGGDEFGVLMEHCSIEQSERLANVLRQSIESFRFNWENKSFRIGISIGLVALTEEFQNMTDLLIAADSCCYSAKDQGRNRVVVYQKSTQEMLERSGQMQWVATLNEALDRNRFRLYRQPLRGKLDEGEHFEVLIRLCMESGQIIAPGAFIPVAERYGLMARIDQHIFDLVFRWFADHPEQLQSLSMCSINLSGATLGTQGVLETIQNKIDYYRLPMSKFCIEITETAAISNLNLATDFMRALKARGCRFALDDFGSGLSSFGYLKNLPVDFLKIDGMFVKDICVDPVDFAMVKAVNEIGHLLGKQTIAEYIENEQTYRTIQTLGIDYAQGYWVGEPKPFIYY